MKRQNGFSLIELLVVVSIIAVLTSIGLMMYSEVQKKARDTERRSDITSIAKALETHYNETSDQYPVLSIGWFEDGVIPTDPVSGYKYCSCSEATAVDITFSNWTTASTCPGADVNGCVTGWEEVSPTKPAAGSSWRICARLESRSEVFCKHNVQ